MTSQSPEAALRLEHLAKAYGPKVVVRDVSFTAAPGEFIVLVGPSGCGKSTILRAIAGLESVERGTISILGKDVTHLAPRERNIAMVFQDYALYPHKSVFENIAFGLRVRGNLRGDQITERVHDAARRLALTDLLDRRPSQLSGGQRQRVAIGRAIVRQPSLFLFDEPLSNLDAQLRGQMRVLIARLHREVGRAIVYVTHDQTEAMTLADRIVVLQGGEVQQVGAPMDLYRGPANIFVAQFIGSPSMNLFHGRLQKVSGPSERWEFIATLPGRSGTDVRVAMGPDHMRGGAVAKFAGRDDLVLGLRPEDLLCVPATEAGDSAAVSGRVDVVEPLGAQSIIYCDVGGMEVQCVMGRSGVPVVGAHVSFKIKPDRVYLFERTHGRSLL